MAPHLLQWEVMRWLRARGVQTYDLVATPPASQLDDSHPLFGLYRFKSGFSEHITEFVGTWDLPLRPRAYALWERWGERAAKHGESSPPPRPALLIRWSRNVVSIQPLHRARVEDLLALGARNHSGVEGSEPHAPYDEAAERARLERKLAEVEQGTGHTWTIHVDGTLAGDIGFNNMHRGNGQSANIGYMVDAGFRGRGVATEAVRLVIREVVRAPAPPSPRRRRARHQPGVAAGAREGRVPSRRRAREALLRGRRVARPRPVRAHRPRRPAPGDSKAP